MKTQAARLSVKCLPKLYMPTLQALFQWAKSNCKETEIFFSSKENHTLATALLKARFYKAVTILGTLQYDAFIPTYNEKLTLKKFSSSEQHNIFSTVKKQKSRKRPAKKTTVEIIAKNRTKRQRFTRRLQVIETSSIKFIKIKLSSISYFWTSVNNTILKY